MAARGVRKSSAVSRFFKWLGLFAGIGGIFLLHYHRHPPSRLARRAPPLPSNLPSPTFVWEENVTEVLTGNEDVRRFKEFEQQLTKELEQIEQERAQQQQQETK